ncbi:38270_t:CDS:10 [Gigaspora margarita]|uniref:urease n=1 Tax=Gigaspora margarita TaxID=4874 RepID=A0ABM8VYR7_GIGMA|nr:38270_t:CDS:10 [Gigaspora margarita]
MSDGTYSVAGLMNFGKQLLGSHVQPDVLETLYEVQAMVVKPGKIMLNEGRYRVAAKVTNCGHKPIQIGSHYHFIEMKPELSFDRHLAYGKRLDIPARSAVRFEPCDTKTVTLVDIGGKKYISGGNDLACGVFDHSKLDSFAAYADIYGPTAGDRLRLGGGKVLRKGMGQSTSVTDTEVLDLAIKNAVIVDWSGIYKADIGFKSGHIAGIGKAGNPDVMDGVTPNMVVGATTEAFAGTFDCHIHFICPQIIPEALSSGITTLIGGDDIQMNFGFTGKGNAYDPEALREQIKAGVMGFVEQAIAALKNRTIHAYHSESTGGPYVFRVCGGPNVIPSLTNPTRPYAANTLEEHVDMNILEDIAFAESHIRAESIAVEDILHDMGAISIMSRVGEVVLRTWKIAHKIKLQRERLGTGDDGPADNFRVKRYVVKYTINHHLVGSIEKGKVANLVMYSQAFFDTKPEIVIKSGIIVWSQMGDANASIPTTQPVISRPMFGAYGGAASKNSYAFVSLVSIYRVQKYGLRKKVQTVKNCINIRKKVMKLNASLPKIEVDPETYVVKADP